MSSYAHIIGDYEVSDRQKAKENISKLLYEGGMMELSQAKLYDKEIVLQKPCSENTKFFNLNYFEDDIMETATLNDNGTIQSSKIGERQFSKVICAVYLYMEMISEKPCLIVQDDHLISSHALGWINHVLGTNYTVSDRYQNLWDKLILIKYNQKIYIDIIKDISQCDAINTNMYRDMMAYLYLYKYDLLKKSENSIADTEAKNNVEDSQKTLHMTHLVNIVRNALVEYKSDHSYEDLINFPFDEKENKRNDIALGLRFFHFIPPQVYASLVAKEMDMSFDEVWNDIKDKHYPYFSNIEESEKKTLTVSTADYLNLASSGDSDIQPYTLTDDDRIYWNAKPSEEMEKWIEELGKRYQKITPKTIGIEEYMELLVKANTTFKRICPFADMFYEFLTNLNDENYQKALLLFDELIEENRESGKIMKQVAFSSWKNENTGIIFNKGRLNIKRYLVLMANVELRKKVFGF